jgi:hypothetical protein
MVRQAHHRPALSLSKGPPPRAAQALAPRALALPPACAKASAGRHRRGRACPYNYGLISSIHLFTPTPMETTPNACKSRDRSSGLMPALWYPASVPATPSSRFCHMRAADFERSVVSS